MKHDWQPYVPDDWGPGQQLLSEPMRRCSTCGAVQQRYTEHQWMRVHRRRWLPLVGRCTHQKQKKIAR